MPFFGSLFLGYRWLKHIGAEHPGPNYLGILLVGSLDFNFLGFYMSCTKEAKGLTSRRGSDVSQIIMVGLCKAKKVKG